MFRKTLMLQTLHQAIPQGTANPNSIASNPFQYAVDTVGTLLTAAIISQPPGVVESASAMNSQVWRAVAANAWNYFQPGIGVNATTGLPRGGGTDAPYFTDWDLGCYIQAVIDANKTGVVGTDGAWGSSQRLEKVVYFLEHRDLSTTGYPYWFYQASEMNTIQFSTPAP